MQLRGLHPSLRFLLVTSPPSRREQIKLGDLRACRAVIGALQTVIFLRLLSGVDEPLEVTLRTVTLNLEGGLAARSCPSMAAHTFAPLREATQRNSARAAPSDADLSVGFRPFEASLDFAAPDSGHETVSSWTMTEKTFLWQ